MTLGTGSASPSSMHRWLARMDLLSDRVLEPGGRVALHVWIGYQVALVALILDQATKRIAELVLDRGVEVALLGEHVGWQLVYNDGGAYGVDAPSWFFLVVTVVVAGIVVCNLPEAPSLQASVAYGLLLAGALGNATDRIFRSGDPGDPAMFHGHVIDFVAWGNFPRFNVADAAITCGFVLLVLDLWLTSRAETGDPAPDEDGVDTTEAADEAEDPRAHDPWS